MVQLDESQRAFIEAPVDQNIRLLAPAGCGKTLCLLYRCKFLAEQFPSRSQRFLIVTFTRAARDELRSRLNEGSEFTGIRDQVEINTLNAWGWRRLREQKQTHSAKIFKKNTYRMKMENLLQPVWKKHERVSSTLQSKNPKIRNQSPKKLMEVIDSIMSLGFDHVRHADLPNFLSHWDELTSQGLEWKLEEQENILLEYGILESRLTSTVQHARQEEFYEAFYLFWREATQHLFESSMFTYECQKYFAYQDEQTKLEQGRLLSGAASYDHVYVDEFQDINPLDLALVRAIAKRSDATVTISGDDDQAIYEWRGATPEYILEPQAYFGTQYDTFTLGVNYRSPANIVERSQLLIKHNDRRVDKQIRADNPALATIEEQHVESISYALEFVHSFVESSIANGTSSEQIALISRKRSQIIPYQIYFASEKIAFCAAEDLQIFLSETFERLIDIITIKYESSNRQRLTKVADGIMSLCRFVKFYPLSKNDRFTLRQHIVHCHPRSVSDAIDSLSQYRGRLKGKNEDGETSREVANTIRKFIEADSVSDALLALSDHFLGLQYDFNKSEEDLFFAGPPFEHLAEYAMRYGRDYDSFIDDIELAKATLVKTPPVEAVQLMTAFRAKGKEFAKVVLLDVEDEIWPCKNVQTPEQLEGERRVFYVAFTRAREQVTMLLRKGAVPSPYIQELGLRV
ncbi:MAG: ATP-dependent helicase [Chloroflexi bacterium]|nr:ATP-dependent helicase [Chloroflexota bacterium]